MKKPDRQPRTRIPVNKEKKDPWRDAPKEEILARGKKKGERSDAEPRPKRKESESSARPERPQRPEARGNKKAFGSERRDNGAGDTRRDEQHPFKKSAFKKGDDARPRRDDERSGPPSKPRKMAKGFGEQAKGSRDEKKPFDRRENRRDDARPPRGDKPFRQGARPSGEGGPERTSRSEKPFARKPRREDDRNDSRGPREARPVRDFAAKKPSPKTEEQSATPSTVGPMTLNKYLAHAGISSRRDAATAIKEGKVKVNGEVLLTPGYRVQLGDKVTFEGKPMKPQVKKVYVLLNKPKGFITTTEDELDRRTVMELVQAVEAERLYPVGRLDRNTTGLLLMTNDGDLAQRLTHPKYEAKKIYQVGLNKPLTKADFEKLLTGVELEDGIAKPDKLSFLETPDELGLEIHSGRNRIVRRMFEALGYEVEKLDRVMFAGLTKKNIPRGQWRHLTEEEVVRLKHFKS